MHRVEGINGKLTLTFPASIAECTDVQYIAFAGLNYQLLTGNISFAELKVQLLYKLLNIKRTVNLEKPSETAARVAENIWRMSELLESFFEITIHKGRKARRVRLDHIHNHLSALQIAGLEWLGPKAALSNISFGQYLAANDAFHDFHAHKDELFLNLLIAHLYVPAGDTYDPKKVEERAEQVAGLDIATRYAVCLFYEACQKWIATNNALDIGGGHMVDLTVLFNAKESNTAPSVAGIGLKSTLYDLAETGVFGDLNETANHNLFEILVFLVTKHHEAEKLKRDAKSKRTAGTY